MEKSKIRTRVRNYLLSHPTINPFEKSYIYYTLIGTFKRKPDILVIGQMKCGTSTMYDYLTRHQNIHPSSRKEIKYFDYRYHHSFNWYKGNLGCWKWNSDNTKSIDASPTYFSVPFCAKRVHKVIPDVKMILLLRNPVDRAYSHYQNVFRDKNEDLTFSDAIEREQKILEDLKSENPKNFDYDNYIAYSYLRFGLYAIDLKRWYNLFPKKNILIIKSEDFEKDVLSEYLMICKFLSIPEPDDNTKNYVRDAQNKKMVANYASLDDDTRRELTKFYEPYNEELYRLIGRDFGWT